MRAAPKRALAMVPITLGLVLLAGCGEDAPAAASAKASAKPAAGATGTASVAKEEALPVLTVDNLGPYLAGERMNLKEVGGTIKLKKVVSELPIKGKEVTLVVLKQAKASDVVAVINELGVAGVPRVLVRHDTRADLPKEILVIPQSQLGEAPPGCSVVSMIGLKLETNIWDLAGSMALKHTKGMAGPDLSNAGETLVKKLEKCDSKVAFFGAEATQDWAFAHMAAGVVKVNDTTKKIEKLVMLAREPVPGNQVKLD